MIIVVIMKVIQTVEVVFVQFKALTFIAEIHCKKPKFRTEKLIQRTLNNKKSIGS